MESLLDYIPYCGTPPVPAVLWSRWNFDPLLLIALVALAAAFALPWWTAAHVESDRRRRLYFVAGWTALALALISPLCNLSIALFSARVGQHMWLALVTAPLIALAAPLRSIARRLGSGWMSSAVELMLRPAVAAALFGVSLWYWHMPRPYQATFESHVVYWIMHATLTGSAVLLWESLLERGRDQLIARLFAAFATLLHMGMLGAIIALSPRLLYPVHLLTTQSWGLSPLDDQQLGGLIMWVPGCTALAIILLVKLRELFWESGENAGRSIARF